MRRLMNLLRGTVEVMVTGPFPERLLNLCAQQGLSFWGLCWQDEHTVRFTTRRGGLRQMEELGDRVGCAVMIEQGRGLPFLVGRFRRRYAFLVGLALSVLAVALLSQVVLTVEVEGNGTVPTAQILSELRRLGLRPGVYGPGLDRTKLAQQGLLRLEGLSWMAVNLYGTRAEVLVREVVEPPKLQPTTGCADLVAGADGILIDLEVLEGEGKVAVGDTVVAGDLLIAGNVELKPPEYSTAPSQWLQVRARGNIWARTWRTLTAEIPLSVPVKAHTGQEKNLWSLTVLGRRVDFFRNGSISWDRYDKISTVRQCILPGEIPLPIYLTVEHCRAYELQQGQLELEAAQAMLEGRLLDQLVQQIGTQGEVLDTTFSARVAGDRLRVTLTAECKEQIGVLRENETPPQGSEPGG